MLRYLFIYRSTYVAQKQNILFWLKDIPFKNETYYDFFEKHTSFLQESDTFALVHLADISFLNLAQC